MSQWQFRPAPSERPPARWADDLSITPLLLELLWRRGFRGRGEIDAYLSARLGSLSHPDLWPGVPEAARILADGILRGKKLAVWGDYDVDGITATTLVLDVLEAHGFDALHHLPDRRREGYGLNLEGIERLAAQGCDLLLTVDCGISDHACIERARELGMAAVVSDHHLPPERLPRADAIIDPRMPGPWPSAHLAGVGVAFYLMAAVNALLAKRTGRRYKMDDALDLAALGTLADVMCLEGENRILVRGGLRRMGAGCRPGIRALKEVSKFDASAEVSSGQAVYRLAPRLNAAGRMGDPELALQLLRSKDYFAAVPLAEALNGRNEERKQEEKRIYGEAAAQAEALLAARNWAALALYGEDWHPGIVGIVASRIVERFARPAVVLCSEGAALKGSGRSVAGFDLHAGLAEAGDCLLGFGGHQQAAGVRLEAARLEDFREAFHQAALKRLGENPPEPALLLEGELGFADASNLKFLKELELMQPFGPGNPEPLFASPPVLLARRSPLGHSGEHVLLEARDEQAKRTLFAKAWRMADKIPPKAVGRHIQLAYTPKIDMYTGEPRIDLAVKDWRLLD